MVHQYTIMGLWFNIFVCILLPVIAIIMLLARKKISIVSVLAGAACFFVTQRVLLAPISQFFQNTGFVSSLFENGQKAALYMIFLAIVATLCTEPIRYVSIRYTVGKQYANMSNIIGFALGYSGFEALLQVGIKAARDLYFAFIINSGQVQLLSNLSSTPDALLSSLQSMNGDTLFMIGAQRVFLFVAQVFLTCFVFLSIKFSNKIFFFIALAASFIINFGMDFILVTTSELGALLFLGVCAAGFFGFLYDIPKVFSGHAVSKLQSPRNNKQKKG